jgi:hypothetical protein
MNLKILTELDRIFKNNPDLVNNKHTLTQVVNGAFDIEIPLLNTSNIYDLCDIIDDAVLARYFGTVWQAETKKYKYSGLAIIDEVNEMNPEAVIDIGCGFNEFSGKIQNLIGIDPYNKRADFKATVLTYQTDTKYDVAICLGSINFGSSDKIIAEVTAAVNLVKPGGLLYFRVNPGIQHTKKEAKWINFYDWDPVFISNLSIALGCDLVMLRQDLGDRFYFVLRKHKG